jgi:kynurenine formamidase
MKRRNLLCTLPALWLSGCLKPEPATLGQALATLQGGRFVDLTHTFAPGIPHWKGAPNQRVERLYNHERDGFQIDEYCHVGQWGTHIDPPSHFHAGKRTLDRIPPEQMLLPLVVLDVHEAVQRNPDFIIGEQHLKDWEEQHGPVPEGAFVALRTDWSKRWPDRAAMDNTDAKGISHYPGWSLPVLRTLFEQRHITAIGHETTDTDPGLATSQDDYSLESYVLAGNHYQIELLTNLDQVPATGAVVMIGAPKPQDGSGFPVRVLAIVPR